MDYHTATAYPEYENFPSNHAPTYNDNPMNPLLAAINGNMEKYINAEDRARYQNYLMQHPLMDDATHNHGAYTSGGGGGAGWGGGSTGTGGTGHSGYGQNSYEAPSGVGGGGGAYNYHPAAPVHVPAGGSYSHHTTAGSGYGVPSPPKYLPHPPPTFATKGSGKKKSSSNSTASTMNALTLLAFFFFVNLLQNCLKENTDAMNPTVMVMTKNVVRNRNTKLAEMNSREQSTSPASAFTSGANIVVQPEDLVSAAAGSSVAAAVPALSSVTLQTSPYSDGGGVASGSSAVNVGSNFAGSASVTSNNNHGFNVNGNQRPAEPQYAYGTNNVALNGQQYHQHSINMNNNNNNNNNHAISHAVEVPFAATSTPAIMPTNHVPRPEFYDSPHPYPNQTLASASNTGSGYNYHQQHQQQQSAFPPEHYEQDLPEHQYPHQHPQPQISPHHQQYEQNQFQQHQHHDQIHTPQSSGHQDHYEEHHQQPSSNDRFQHHYSSQHSLHQSPFHSHQHRHYGEDRRPLRPGSTHSDSAHPWSYSPGSSSVHANKRGSSYSPLSSYTWSSAHVSGNNNFDDRDDDDNRRYDDSFYTRSVRNSQ